MQIHPKLAPPVHVACLLFSRHKTYHMTYHLTYHMTYHHPSLPHQFSHRAQQPSSPLCVM